MRERTPGFIANFDSSAAMLRAQSNFLRGDDFPALGQTRALEPLARAATALPRRIREEIYAVAGALEAISPRELDRIDVDETVRWSADRYPERRYPAVMIGSANGAAVHLGAALGAPWLPQTFLIPVRERGVDADEPLDALEKGRKFGPRLVEANPEWQLHHMHDANQDRLMIRYMDYYRVKRRRLGERYEAFLRDRLAPGAPIIIVECERQWPTTRIGERHVFQHGALGGATEEEFHRGSSRVEDYLERYGSHRRRWNSPQPDGESPEAEWGFEPALREDILRVAREIGHPVVRLVFQDPEDLSPVVADFYRWWYHQRGLKANRLLVESFIILEPYWALKTGSVPFWMKFNTEDSADSLERYVGGREAFDEIYLMLFNHGVEAVGLPPLDHWRAILSRATRRGQFLGLDEEHYPLDFGAFGRYHSAIQSIPSRYPVPGPLPFSTFVEFLARSEDRYNVSLLSGEA